MRCSKLGTGLNTFVNYLEPGISGVGLSRLLIDVCLHLILRCQELMLHHRILLEGLEMGAVVWMSYMS